MSRPAPAGLAGFQERVMALDRIARDRCAAPSASAATAMPTAMRQWAPKFSSNGVIQNSTGISQIAPNVRRASAIGTSRSTK